MSVRDHYEAYPYPARDPGDEATRLITGSPSFPVEMDHCLWGGVRDWRAPLQVLVAGGGTGDGLVQLAQRMTEAGRPYAITYLDLSEASRRIAEARIAARGLSGVRFETGSLLDAASLGPFDYIDCCGVLHHLPDPGAGFAALRAALAPGGGLGFMVYAPHGRAGVYPLQQAFAALTEGMDPASRLAAGKAAFDAVPAGHPFRRNPHLGDHAQSDAGFYDLLLHSQDRAFEVGALLAIMADAGWALAQFATPALYDLSRLVTPPADMDAVTRMVVAERLRGTLKVHVGYARAAGTQMPTPPRKDRIVPHLNGVPAARLAQAVAQGRVPPLRQGAETFQVHLPKEAAPLIAAMDGRASLYAIAKSSGLKQRAFDRAWAAILHELGDWGLVHLSRMHCETG